MSMSTPASCSCQREVEQPGARHEPRARLGGLHELGILQLGEQPRATTTDDFGELVPVDYARAVVGPWFAERLVDTEPLRDRRAGAVARDEITNGRQRQPAIAQLGDQLEPLAVVVGVDRVAPALGRLRQQTLRLVPADRAGRHATARDERGETKPVRLARNRHFVRAHRGQ